MVDLQVADNILEDFLVNVLFCFIDTLALLCHTEST